MNVKLRRLLMPLLRHDAAGKPPTFRTRSAARQAIYLIGKPTAKKIAAKVRQRSEKQSARASHNQETWDIRTAVRARAGGVCEGCGKRWGFWLWTMDHWENGVGRKRQKQSVANCWALCGNLLTPDGCHYKRQHYVPSVEFWNAAFAAHAAKHGYPPLPHIEHQSLPAKAGGAP